jgi:hypothetical protein
MGMIQHLTALVVLSIMAITGTVFSQSTQLLFSLERNKNSNKVYYEANVDKVGALDMRDPIRIYWILWKKDSTGKTREDLTLMEKNMVYGCKIDKKSTPDHLGMTIVSYSDRKINVVIQNGKAVAEIMINDSLAYLDKIYIHSRETRMFPKVNYIELFGRAATTGDSLREKIDLHGSSR